MKHDQVNWPAFVKYAGDDELALVADEDCWQREFEDTVFEPADFLVDSDGCRFMPGNAGMPQSGQVDSDELGRLLRNHFAALGECCIAKIPGLPAIEALRLLQNGGES